MRFLIYTLLLLISTSVAAQKANKKEVKEYKLFVTSVRKDDQKARAQIDVLMKSRQFLKRHNIRAYRVLPESIKPVLSKETRDADQVGKFRRLLKTKKSFQVILIDDKGTTVFRGERVIAKREIADLLDQSAAQNNPRAVELDSIQSK